MSKRPRIEVIRTPNTVRGRFVRKRGLRRYIDFNEPTEVAADRSGRRDKAKKPKLPKRRGAYDYLVRNS